MWPVPNRMRRKWLLALGVPLLFIVVWLVAVTINLWPVADHTEKLHLELIARSIYDYHASAGRWPTQPGDLLQTSLPQQCPHDVAMMRAGAFVVNWPTADWQPTPQENADRLLLYSKGGPLRFGRVWVCWGDLRLEYMKEEHALELLRQTDEP